MGTVGGNVYMCGVFICAAERVKLVPVGVELNVTA